MKNIMNSHTYSSIISLLVVSICQAETGSEPLMRESVTREQLSGMYREASQNDPMRKQPATKGPDPSIVNQPKSLIGVLMDLLR
jgi:hypothetical protein